jgi:cell division protein FtsB
MAVACLALVLLGLQVRLWISPHGMREAIRLSAEVATQRVENEALAQRNERLAAEVEDLRDGLAAIEERARTDLGMIGRSETFYRIVRPRRELRRTDER